MDEGYFLHLGAAVYLSDRGSRKPRHPIGFQTPKGDDMGHFYRERHGPVAGTTFNESTCELETSDPKATASWIDLKVPELRAAAESLGLDTKGTKEDLVKRLERHSKS